MEKQPTVAVIMGSDSDFPALRGCVKRLKDFGIKVETRVISAHRTPERAKEFAQNAQSRGVEVIIGAAGKAAHLPGVLAAFTTLPVIGIPMKSSFMDGMDSLLSIVQMPKGIPVATVAVEGGENAAILAAQILALAYPALGERLAAFKADMESEVIEKDKYIMEQAESI